MSTATPRRKRAFFREEGRISSIQFTWLITTIVTSYTGALVPGLLITIAGVDAWLSVAVAWGGDVAIAAILAYMGLRFHGETLIEYSSSVLGPWVGRPVGLMFSLFFFMAGSILARSVSDTILTMLLPGTPMAVVTAVILAVAAYGARAGLETTARAAEVLGPLFVLGGGTALVLIAPKIEMAYLRPVLEHGVWPPLVGSVLPLSSLGVCIIMGMFQAYHGEPHRAFAAKVRGVTMGVVMVAVAVAASTALLGARPAGNLVHPDLAIVRNITIAEFLERLEPIWLSVAVGAGVLSVTILLWASALGLAQTLGLREYQSLVWPLASLMVPISIMLFEGTVDQNAFILNIWPAYASFVEIGLVGLVWLVALVRGKRGSRQSPGPAPKPARPR